MADEQKPSRRDELSNILAPEHVTAFVREISGYLSSGTASVAHIMPLAWRIGHLAMEPHALWELFRESHDQQIIVIPPATRAYHSAGVRAVIEPFVTIAETTNRQTMLMGHMDAGTLSVGPLTWYQRGPAGLLDDYIKLLNNAGRQPRHFPIPEKVSFAAQEFCERRGIGERDRIVVLNVRDRNFLPDQDAHFYRTADITTYEPAVRYLLDQGYWVLRTGLAGSVDAPFAHPRYLDIWKEPDYTDLLDPGLIARAHFGISCSSGPEAIFRILGVPQLMANGVLQSGMWMNPQDKLVFKTYHAINDGKPAKLHSLLMQGVALFSDVENVARCGFTVKDNTAEEILEAVIEMDASLSNEHRPDETANQRFLKIGADYQAFLGNTGHPADRRSVARRQTQYGYALPWTQLADSYVSFHPEFLE
ncbi:TIGR04372 family glycosyltransferase [Nisaea denitrificans]|uniref:TIGR04372 family glycosyltransferase n=1 Tax=Nisaea denitrificans TaxID=390877 RepID=UPI00041DBD33|nr:TIGR04372 family glycosyltransferase [Nisaea denitrificans]